MKRTSTKLYFLHRHADKDGQSNLQSSFTISNNIFSVSNLELIRTCIIHKINIWQQRRKISSNANKGRDLKG